MNKRASGNIGEDIAEKYLSSLGYDVVKRNYYTRYGEIDIIANKDDVLVFIEVKKRTGSKYGTGAQAVTSKKIGRIRTCASIYLQENNLHDVKMRFDIIEVNGSHGHDINHIEAAF